MTFHVLNANTNKVISRSNVRIEGTPTSPNLRIESLTTPKVVISHHPPSDYFECNEEAPAVTEEGPPNASTSSPKNKMPIL